ncbi:MAG: autoinducer synthase [Hyphomicrobium sp.]|nr:autoinducer synthase [Hyphomicrobium sp.]
MNSTTVSKLAAATQSADVPVVTFTPRQTGILPGTAKFPFDMHVTTNGMDRSDAYALRFKAYDAAGYPPEEGAGSFSDPADGFATTAVIAAYDNGKCVGTLRVCFSYPWQPISNLPCSPYFPAIKAVKAVATSAVVEVGRLAIDPDITNTSYRTTLYAALVRAAFIAAQAGGASDILLTARPTAVPFYKAMLGFKPVGGTAIYPPGDAAITLLAGSIGDAEQKQRAQNAFFRITPEEIASMRIALGEAIAQPVHVDRQPRRMGV